MKFEKSVYKSAMDKIDNPEKRTDCIEAINQKYKADVLSGNISDELAGWDNSEYYYDTEMLKKEVNKKIVVSLLLAAVGIVAMVLLAPIFMETIDIKMNGTRIRAYYSWSPEKNEYGYVYRWVYVDGEAKQDMMSEFTEVDPEVIEEREAATRFMASIWLQDNVSVVARYDEAGEEFRKKNDLPVSRELVEKAEEAGIVPVDIYLFVTRDVSIWKEYVNNQYVDMYYLAQDGETVMDARPINRWQVLAVAMVVLVVYITFWIGRMIKLGKEQRECK